jgi:hypothetical protein
MLIAVVVMAEAQPQTVCIIARRAKDPQVVGSVRDRDTDTCRGAPMSAQT